MENREEIRVAKELLDNRQYIALRHFLMEQNETDVADILEEMNNEDMLRCFRILPKTMAADVFSYMDVENAQFIITSLSDKDAGQILDNLMVDDAVDFLEEMPANVVTRVLASASPETRRDINHLLKYPEDSAGSIMTVEFIDLKANLTVVQAIERVRKLALDSETVNYCYVLDDRRMLIGIVALRQLLLQKEDALIGDFMDESVISVHTLTDQEEVADLFMRYDFSAMPVVDNDGRLVGVITVDDIMDIVEEETTEDIELMNAIVPGDKPYMKTTTFELWKSRIPWLMLLMISSTFTGQIIASFEDALSTCVVLTVFIPMLMGTGGNAGGQASATIIRGLSVNDIEFSDLLKVIWKEIKVAVLCGLTLAVCNFAKLMMFDKTGVTVAAVVSLTMALVVILAKIAGSLLPMLVKKIGLDPAVIASPFITTIVDAMSLMIYFTIATMMLNL